MDFEDWLALPIQPTLTPISGASRESPSTKEVPTPPMVVEGEGLTTESSAKEDQVVESIEKKKVIEISSMSSSPKEETILATMVQPNIEVLLSSASNSISFHDSFQLREHGLLWRKKTEGVEERLTRGLAMNSDSGRNKRGNMGMELLVFAANQRHMRLKRRTRSRENHRGTRN
ncbi:unnamed protein product [Linum trigynum]|uniref:Uncharacterized protein n=1 Tax=Linum trigynum TaxID=586398 RepID=A0AAV2G8E1_9ROSI